ncbi:four helix bundle protein [Lacimicrobium sp. SS2-24]|uniref:four helix bundle protein n=1 Tax=Lacimicrobium sp. SS2-24 TaxID=2005569 RepID=UPI000B4A81C9|nr:four helix bundle protein [Lacimicrobium sp. SS2-24]
MKFEELEVWKRSARLSAELYKWFRETRDYGFKDQITRSALSIPSNIAEGAERDSKKDFLRFLDYAKGSSAELRTQIYIGLEVGYIENQTAKAWLKETREISAMIVGLMHAIRKSHQTSLKTET